MARRKARVHQTVHPKKATRKQPKSARPAPVEDVWAKERAALASGAADVPRRRGRPRDVWVPPPPELAEAVGKAEGADGLAKALKGIAVASLKEPRTPGYLSPKVANVLLNVAKEARQVQMRLKAKEGAGAQLAGAFEILTTQEREVLEAYRAGKRVTPLKPGETPPPPPMDEEPAAPAKEVAPS